MVEEDTAQLLFMMSPCFLLIRPGDDSRLCVHGSQDASGFAPTSPVLQYVPSLFGWRLLPVTQLVSAVQNMGQCGSCLAFSVQAFTAASRRLPSLCARLPKIGTTTLVVFVCCCLCLVVLPSVCLGRRRNATTSSLSVRSSQFWWREFEVVSAVKSQCHCGSCREFSRGRGLPVDAGFCVDLAAQLNTSARLPLTRTDSWL